MSAFGEDLVRSLNEALAHARGEGPAAVHTATRSYGGGPARSAPAGEAHPDADDTAGE